MPLTRRAFLGGGLAATLHPLQGAAAERAIELGAVALPGPDIVFGYNGGSPGPTLRGQIGKPLRLRFANKLETPTSLAFPGLRIANGDSGFAGAPVAPGEEREIAVTPVDAGFNLYLPYGPGAPTQLSAGLFGPLVVDEASPPAVDLDAVLVFSLAGAALRANAVAGPLALSAPPGGRARVRLANATPDRSLALSISGATAQVIAVDGAPSAMFAPREGRFPMAPSSRFEIILDLPLSGRVVFASDNGPALQIETSGARAPSRPPIAPLAESSRLPREIALERAQQVAITLTETTGQGFAINGRAKDGPAKPLFKAARGSPVALTIVNKTSTPQTLRLEGHVARQLHALDDGWEPYWRDALLIGPGKTLHAAFVADNFGKWPLASASPEKRAMGMMGWFVVG